MVGPRKLPGPSEGSPSVAVHRARIPVVENSRGTERHGSGSRVVRDSVHNGRFRSNTGCGGPTSGALKDCFGSKPMTSIRRFTCDDLFSFNNVNLDYFTETYHLPFYLEYLARWPEYCLIAEAPGQQAMGYILGKAEGEGVKWHGHVTAVTVAPEYRTQGLARELMNFLEFTTEAHRGYFVDLFVRVSNTAAIQMYKKFGYTVFRQVIGYYSGAEDAYDMRKAMSRDRDKASIVPLKRPVMPSELEFD